ncbi:insulin-like growth factor-binding protein 1 isoform X2 [Ochotona curzoniae]|uniref:insulin-like growth factor-binding protein 1 isoform X2 n=1 Tax=Ochotona curzoniae TaxID=130825 RepID=UPI001B349BB2|nr:insulin-like growth factor-binding protein 1 isoform X2 [Ochotona curzoniae]
MPETPAVRPWPFLLLLAIQVASAISASQPWHCAPCSAEKLALCPPVPASCPEVSRPAGCGCCPMCALPLGAACGVATARCARGLSCRALPGEPRPLHALTRGQGSCVLDSSASDAETSAPAPRDSVEMTEEQLVERLHLTTPSGEDQATPWNTISTFRSPGAAGATDGKQWKGPCQRELYRVLEQLTKARQEAGEEIYKFYLPNCNKNGFFHSKQCEASLDGEPGLCWCVYPWNGKRISGVPAVRGDPNCPQHLTVQH